MPDCYVIIDARLKRMLFALSDDKRKQLEKIYRAVLIGARNREGSVHRFYYDQKADKVRVIISFREGTDMDKKADEVRASLANPSIRGVMPLNVDLSHRVFTARELRLNPKG